MFEKFRKCIFNHNLQSYQENKLKYIHTDTNSITMDKKKDFNR